MSVESNGVIVVDYYILELCEVIFMSHWGNRCRFLGAKPPLKFTLSVHPIINGIVLIFEVEMKHQCINTKKMFILIVQVQSLKLR